MAEDELEGGGKGRSTGKKLVMIVVILLVLALLAGLGLFLYFYLQKGKAAEQEAPVAVAEPQLRLRTDDVGAQPGGKGDAKGSKEPVLVKKASPELTRFEYTYHEMQRPLLANLTNSRKVIQVQVAIMTRYDDRVIANVKRHELALRSVALDVMRKITEDELSQPNFRKDLAERIRAEINLVLEKFEAFGGIEEVYFTSFVVQ